MPELPRSGAPERSPCSSALQIITVERKADGITSTGRIPIAENCFACGMSVKVIYDVVPIELERLTFDKDGGKNFRFSISSIKPNKAKGPNGLEF
jgi:hypothetical protein